MSLLQAQPNRRSATTPLVLVTGGKGGVGKSTITAELGVMLASQGLRVLAVDFDLGLANLDVILRVGSARTIEDALAGDCSWSDCVVKGPGGLHVLPASSGSAHMARSDDERRSKLLAAVRELGEQYDLLIGDSAAGIGQDVLGFAANADHVFVVTSPSPAALTDAYGLIKALDTFGQENECEVPTPEIVVNRVTGVEEAEATAKRLQRVCERFLCRRPRRAGWLPFSNALPLSQKGVAGSSAGVPNTLYRNCLERLGARVSRLLTSATVASGS
jgi:flagellar biosynthesis protein FlhG